MVCVPNMEVLGEIVWLMSQSGLHKQFFISDLEWLVMTPVLLGQFRLFYDQQKPIGVVFWGFVMPEACFQHDAEVEARLSQGVKRLRPQDWKSGDRLWVMPEACFQHDEVIAPFGGVMPKACFQHDEMVKDLKEKVFPGRELKFLAAEAGRVGVKAV